MMTRKQPRCKKCNQLMKGHSRQGCFSIDSFVFSFLGSQYVDVLFTPALCSLIKNGITNYYKRSVIPLRDLVWEEILNCAFRAGKRNTKWCKGSHKSGADITIFGADATPTLNLSVKGGVLKNNMITFSSYRTT